MHIKLLTFTPEPEKVVANSARLCYSSEPACSIEVKNTEALIKKLLDSGHGSPFEHVSFTFGIDGISRVTANQLVRHRIASFSQKSQRYVSENEFSYIVPKTVTGRNLLLYMDFMKRTQDTYNKLVEAGVPKEDARYVLPNACSTSIVVTMNARALFNFFELRCCSRAQSEIQELANQMLKQVKQVAPIIFSKAGAPCERCPEGGMSCKGGDE